MSLMAQVVTWLVLAATCPRTATAVAQGAVTLDNYTFDKMLDHPGWSFLVKFDKTHAHGDKEKAFKELAQLAGGVQNFFVGEVPIQEYGEKQNVDLRERFGITKEDVPAYIFFKPGDKKGLKYTGEIKDDLISIWLRKHGVKLTALGSIAELDELARKYIQSSFAEEHFAEALKLANGQFKQDKMAPVYERIMVKLQETKDAGYIEKEAARIGKVVAQGGGNNDKINDKLKILASILEKAPSDVASVDSLDVVFVTAAGEEKTKVFPKKPLGMHFEQTLPMKVKSVQDQAKDLGVEAGWEVKTLGGTEIKGKGFTFAEAMDVLKMKVALLPGKNFP